MTSKRTRNSRARARRKQIEARHSIEEQRQQRLDDYWAGPETAKALQKFLPTLSPVERPPIYRGALDDPEFVEAYQASTHHEYDPSKPGDLMLLDWVEPQDYCFGIVPEDDAEPVIYHRPHCGHDKEQP